MPAWLTAGVRHVRLEFVQESAAQVTQIIALYQQGLRGTMEWTDIAKAVRMSAPTGVTEGSFFVPDDYLVIPLR